MTTALATGTRYIALAVFSTDQFKIYPILFANEAVALAWIEAHPWELDGPRANTYVTGEAFGDLLSEAEAAQVRPINPDDDPALFDLLYPTCEHGMDGNLCNGPDHFLSYAQERALFG